MADETFAILKARLPRSMTRRTRVLSYRIWLPATTSENAAIKIVSLLNHAVAADATAIHRARNDAIDFRVRLATLGR